MCVWVDGFGGWMEKALGVPTLKTKSINRTCFLLPGSDPLERIHTCISEFGVLISVACVLQAVPCSPLQRIGVVYQPPGVGDSSPRVATYLLVFSKKLTSLPHLSYQ